MVGRLSKILKELNIGLQTARSFLGNNMTLNSKITEGQLRHLKNCVHNLTLKPQASTTKPISAPSDYSHGVPEQIYDKSAQEIGGNKTKKKRKSGKNGPKASAPKRVSAKYSDAYSLQLMKNSLARKYEGYDYGLSDW
jgi:hypothetical protein